MSAVWGVEAGDGLLESSHPTKSSATARGATNGEHLKKATRRMCGLPTKKGRPAKQVDPEVHSTDLHQNSPTVSFPARVAIAR